MQVDRRIKMKERMAKIRADFLTFWSSRTKKQQITYISTTVGIIIAASLLTYFFSRTEYVPLYTDVSRAEVGRIKEVLDAQGVPNRIAPGGTTNLVPKDRVDELLVTLASEGFPKTGLIDYTIFSENAGFGMSDNEFNMLKVASMQTELANLIKGIEGVQDATVMITLPTQGVYLTDQNEGASAAIMLKTNPGHQFSEAQIKSLYQLVSKSLPNLATEDIWIMNQYSEYFDLDVASQSNGATAIDQMAVKRTIERDLQRQVQTMLGTMMGHDKVVVSVTTDIDFKHENREENLVQPVDEESMEGIALSVQRITESFTGNGPLNGGTLEGQDPTDNGTTYVEGLYGNGDYERMEETVNNEVNRIRKEIVESPYKIRNLGIQVMVEPPISDDAESLPEGLQEDIEKILSTIVRTTIDQEAASQLTAADIEDRIVVSFHQFNGKTAYFDSSRIAIPWWIYIVGAALLLVAIILVVLFIRNRRKQRELEEEMIIEEQRESLVIDDINVENENENTIRRKQLEKMAKEKPEEFAKLLRTWIAEE